MKRASQLFLFWAITLMAAPVFSASVAFDGTCYASESDAYNAFILSWPQIQGTTTGAVMSLNSSSLAGNVITFTIKDGGGGVSVARSIYLFPCASSQVSLGGYPLQNIVMAVSLVFPLLLGFGHGMKITKAKT